MYLDFFDLSDKPFEITPDPKFFFLTEGHRQALEATLRGLEEGKIAVLLSGEVGTGKTLLVYALLDQLPKEIKTALIFHSTHDFQELLGQILSELGQPVPAGDRESLVRQWLDYVRQVREQGGRLVVIVDEAQKLSRNVLEDLFSLWEIEPALEGAFQLILSGQPELDHNVLGQLVKNPRLKNSVRTHIAPLTYQESLNYIEHRLRIAGGISSRLFSAPALSWICEFAQGIPRVLNIVCDNALLYAYSQARPTVDLDIIQKVITNLSGPDTGEKIPSSPTRETLRSPTGLTRSQKKGLAAAVVLSLLTGLFFLVKDRLIPVSENKIVSREVRVIPGKVSSPSPVVSPAEKKRGDAGKVMPELRPSSPPRELGAKKPEAPSALPAVSQTVKVEKGKTLTGLAREHYGQINRSLLDLILTYNPSITDADLILENQKVRLPKIREDSLLVAAPGRTFSLHLGTFYDANQANRFKNQTALQGLTVAVIPRKVSSTQTWYRVEAVGYQTRQEALEASTALKKEGILPLFKE